MAKSIQTSIVIPVYESQGTLRACLDAIQEQTFQDFEIVLVDSSPSDRCEEIIRAHFPEILYIRSQDRLLPHEARNLGVEAASSDLIVFTDPDVYPMRDWLEKLLLADEGTGDLVVGAVVPHGNRWIDRGVHYSKFDIWLPGGEKREVEIAPTVNLLCPRSTFLKVGGYRGEYMLGDTVFSWDVADLGNRIWFLPEAVLAHHHMSTWLDLLRERFYRGMEFGRLRAERKSWGFAMRARHILLSLLPLRWTNLVLRGIRNSTRAQLLRDYLSTLPIVLSAHAAWLLGEVLGYLNLGGKLNPV